MSWWTETKLIWKLNSVKSGHVRYETAFTLAESGTPRAVRALIEACHDKSASENSPAVLRDAIGKVTNVASVPVLISAVQNKALCWQARVGAIGALAIIKDSRVINALQQVLDDQDVAQTAAEALKAFGQAPPPEKKIVRGNIHACAEDGDAWNVERLVASDKSLISNRDSMQRTPLHRAARGGQTAIIQTLLDKGASIMARDEYQWTPLHMAAESDKAEAVRLLIDRGAEVNARDSDLRTALHRAAEHNSVNAIKVLLEKAPATLIPAGDDTGKTAKAVAIAMGHKEAVQMIEQYE